jgi:hypothetical protein
MMEMLMERILLHQGGAGGHDDFDFPTTKALEQQDMPAAEEGEDFRLRRRICKSRENYGMIFYETELLIKKR